MTRIKRSRGAKAASQLFWRTAKSGFVQGLGKDEASEPFGGDNMCGLATCDAVPDWLEFVRSAHPIPCEYWMACLGPCQLGVPKSAGEAPLE